MESAVLVKIVANFLTRSGTKVPGGRKTKDDVIAELRADIAFPKQRLMVLEQVRISEAAPKAHLKRPR